GVFPCPCAARAAGRSRADGTAQRTVKAANVTSTWSNVGSMPVAAHCVPYRSDTQSTPVLLYLCCTRELVPCDGPRRGEPRAVPERVEGCRSGEGAKAPGQAVRGEDLRLNEDRATLSCANCASEHVYGLLPEGRESRLVPRFCDRRLDSELHGSAVG